MTQHTYTTNGASSFTRGVGFNPDWRIESAMLDAASLEDVAAFDALMNARTPAETRRAAAEYKAVHARRQMAFDRYMLAMNQPNV